MYGKPIKPLPSVLSSGVVRLADIAGLTYRPFRERDAETFAVGDLAYISLDGHALIQVEVTDLPGADDPRIRVKFVKKVGTVRAVAAGWYLFPDEVRHKPADAIAKAPNWIDV